MVTIGDCLDCGRRCRAGSEYCATCEGVQRKASKIQASDNNTAINKRSKKGADVDRRYLNRLRTWKRGKKCTATFPHTCTNILEAHHMHGRSDSTYFDEWAEEHDIVLTLDERFWKPLCSEAHSYVTKNSKWAWENGYSFKRITDKIFIKK
jgi:hypothetical protein